MRTRTRSNIDIIRSQLSEPNADELLKHYFKFLKKQLQDPQKMEVTFAEVGRFKVKPFRLKKVVSKIEDRIHKIDTEPYDGKGDKLKRRERLALLLPRMKALLESHERISQKGKSQKSSKRNGQA